MTRTAVRPDAERTFLRLAREQGLLTVDQSVTLVEGLRARGETGLYAIRDGAMRSGLLSEHEAYGVFRQAGKEMRQVPDGVRSIGDFALVSEIGRGSMGVVYQAIHRPAGRTVALKLLPPRLGSDPVFLKRFFQEARAAARLDHPNIVRALDVGYADGFYYFAMEHIDGPNLKDIVDRKGPLKEREAVKVVYYCAQALAHAHQAGIHHRDVKPANILVSREGKVKLTDLGLARVEGADDPALSEDGRSVGTPFYMAPEQALLKRKVDARCDLYALGCTLYYLLTGRPPYLGRTPSVILAKHISAPVPDPRQQRPELSPSVTKLCRWLMAKRPEDRPADAGELARYLKALLAAEKSGKRPPAAGSTASPRDLPGDGSAPSMISLNAVATVRAGAAHAELDPGQHAAQAPGEGAGRAPRARTAPPPRDPTRGGRSRPELEAVGDPAGGGSRQHGSGSRSRPELPAASRPERHAAGERGEGARGSRSRGELTAVAAGAGSRKRGGGSAGRQGSNPALLAVGGNSSGSVRRLSGSGRYRSVRVRRSGSGSAGLFAAVAAALLLVIGIGLVVTRDANRDARPTARGGGAGAGDDGPPAGATEAERAAYYAKRERVRQGLEADERWIAENEARRAGQRAEVDEAEARRLAGMADSLAGQARSERERREREAAEADLRAAHAAYRRALAAAVVALRQHQWEAAAVVLESARPLVTDLGARAGLDLDHLAVLRVEQLPQLGAEALRQRVGKAITIRLDGHRTVEGTLAAVEGQTAMVALRPQGEMAVDLVRVPPDEMAVLIRGPLARRDAEHIYREGIRRAYTGDLAGGRKLLAEARDQGIVEATRILERLAAIERDPETLALLGPAPAPPAAAGPELAGEPARPETPKPGAGTPTTGGRAGGEGERPREVDALTEPLLLRLFEIQPLTWDGQGLVRFQYELLNRLKRLGSDWTTLGEAPRFDVQKQVMKCEQGPGLFVHRGVYRGKAKIELDVVFESAPQRGSALRLFAENAADRKSYIETWFALNAAEMREGKPHIQDGARNPVQAAIDELKPFQPYTLALEIDGALAKVMVDGAVRAHLEGVDPETSWRLCVAFERVNVQIREIRVAGRLDLAWVAEAAGVR